MAYDVGDTAVLEAQVTAAIDGDPRPTSGVFEVIDPLGVTAIPALTATLVDTIQVPGRTSALVDADIWRAFLPCTLPGIYRYGFVGTGAASGVEWRTLAVRGE